MSLISSARVLATPGRHRDDPVLKELSPRLKFILRTRPAPANPSSRPGLSAAFSTPLEFPSRQAQVQSRWPTNGERCRRGSIRRRRRPQSSCVPNHGQGAGPAVGGVAYQRIGRFASSFSPGSRRNRVARAMDATSRARAAPRQPWTPVPNARWLPGGRPMSKRRVGVVGGVAVGRRDVQYAESPGPAGTCDRASRRPRRPPAESW